MTTAVEVSVVECAGDGAQRPQEFGGRRPYEVCLVRRGLFRYRDRRATVLVDPATALLGGPDADDYTVDHPHPGGDHDTFLHLEAVTLATLAGGEVSMPSQARINPTAALLHRRLLAVHARHPTGLLADDLAVQLVAAVLAEAEPTRLSVGPRTGRTARRLVDDARAVLGQSLDLSMVEVAARVGCSPHHLSRVFRRTVGVGFATYRTGLRAQRALDGLVDGAPSLTELAHTCGFYDHAHLTRTVVELFGATPSELRRQWHRGAHESTSGRAPGDPTLGR